jgi:hypothetical protein
MDPHRLGDLPPRSSFRLIGLLGTESCGGLPALALFGFLRGNLPRSVLN